MMCDIHNWGELYFEETFFLNNYRFINTFFFC